MNCAEYRAYSQRIDQQYKVANVQREIHASDEYKAWQEHSESCERCEKWEMKDDVRRRGIDPDSFPCVHMAYYSSSPMTGHNVVIHNDEGFALKVRDDGASVIQITYCPWCGTKIN